MIELIDNIFIRFAWETGILPSIKEYSDYWILVLIFLSIMTCFFGFKSYRLFFSLITFGLVLMAISYLLKNRTDWGSIVTTFSVLGTILGFLAYRWKYLGLGFMGWLISIGLLSMKLSNPLIVMGLSIISTGLVFLFPVLAMSLLTSIFGSVIIKEIFYLGNSMTLLLIILGLGFQIFTSKNQTLFEKRYAYKIDKLIKEKLEGRTAWKMS